MQKKEAKGFFFNAGFKRPIILRTLLFKGRQHRKWSAFESDVEKVGGSVQFISSRKDDDRFPKEGESPKKISGL